MAMISLRNVVGYVKARSVTCCGSYWRVVRLPDDTVETQSRVHAWLLLVGYVQDYMDTNSLDAIHTYMPAA
jgi:hypothetical protein